jgi:hypothetical protein
MGSIANIVATLIVVANMSLSWVLGDVGSRHRMT